MKAIIRSKGGKDFSTMKVENISSSILNSGELRVKMVSSRINPVDMDLMKGFPSLKYKSPQIGGVDGAGEVLEVGKGVSKFKVGDKVMFYRLFSDIGTWAEEITIKALDCSKVPSSIEVKQAGSIALPILTAYEGLISLQPKSGESILIHGAGGGVGFQAVQLAKKMELKVIANASERDKEDLVKAGVDEIIDYKKEDFLESLKSQKPDYVFDVVGKETLKKSILIKPKSVVSTTFPDVNQMHKTGVKLPGVLKFLMNLMTRKFKKLAQKNNVNLIGQVTGANGDNIQKAIDILGSDFIPRPYRSISFEKVEESGLQKSDVGRVIEF